MALHHNGFGASTTTTTTNPLCEEEQVPCGSGSSGNGDGSEQDEEDGSISELTRQMARCKFQEDVKDSDSQQKIWALSGSPQSTLLQPFGSTNCGQNGPSREASPPVTEDYGWDTTMLHHEEQRLMSSVPAKSPNQALTDYQIQTIQFYKLKQEQVARKQFQGSGGQNSITNNTLHHKQLEPQKLQYLQKKEKPKPRSSPNPWSNPGPAYQHYLKSNQLQPSGSGMRAVFLGGSGSRSRSCGTGVFLPRGDRSNPSESRKKPGCSTVLIPARVAQALKLHFEQVGVVSRANTNNIIGPASDLPSPHDVGKNQDQKWHFPMVPASNNHQFEMGLPQEWTY